jgi:hypothetical protein
MKLFFSYSLAMSAFDNRRSDYELIKKKNITSRQELKKTSSLKFAIESQQIGY